VLEEVTSGLICGQQCSAMQETRGARVNSLSAWREAGNGCNGVFFPSKRDPKIFSQRSSPPRTRTVDEQLARRPNTGLVTGGTVTPSS
jgi:hypothetical protein